MYHMQRLTVKDLCEEEEEDEGGFIDKTRSRDYTHSQSLVGSFRDSFLRIYSDMYRTHRARQSGDARGGACIAAAPTCGAIRCT